MASEFGRTVDFKGWDRPEAATDPGQAPAAGWMQSGFLQRLFGRSRAFRKLSMGATCRFELALLAGHKARGTLDRIRRARRERESLMTANEAFIVHSLAAAQSRLAGDMAEVGVYQGSSAKLISLASGQKPLHLFDTFSGLPEPGPAERRHLRGGQYAATQAAVRQFLSLHGNISFHPGEFPATAAACDEVRFSFVHLDVDLAASTRACLEFFYPRMLKGGVILTHDYSFLAGVKAACDGFLQDRAEIMIELPTSQAMLVKL